MADSLAQLIFAIKYSALYDYMMLFIGAYPIFGGILWCTTAFIYWYKREKLPQEIEPSYTPRVSVIISAYNEEKYISAVIESLLQLNYPNYEIIVVDDGSTDNTPKILDEYNQAGKIRFIAKTVNQGKAMALNDAIPCASGEIIFGMDADSVADPDVLKYLVPHFQRPRVAVVAGNPRVVNSQNMLTRLQLIEYTTVLSMLRRSQRIWGRIMAFSGVVFALRKSAFFHVGGFSPAAATEDTDLTWKLQRQFWDVLYEPRALVWTAVPQTYKGLFKQRLRWSRGLMYVLHRHIRLLFSWKHRRMWPIIIENITSTLWSFCFVLLLVLWILCIIANVPIRLGASPLPALWGTVIATISIIQCTEGFWLDRKYDPELKHYFPYTVYYPLYYWVFLAAIAVLAIPALFKKPRNSSTWNSQR